MVWYQLLQTIHPSHITHIYTFQQYPIPWLPYIFKAHNRILFPSNYQTRKILIDLLHHQTHTIYFPCLLCILHPLGIPLTSLLSKYSFYQVFCLSSSRFTTLKPFTPSYFNTLKRYNTIPYNYERYILSHLMSIKDYVSISLLYTQVYIQRTFFIYLSPFSFRIKCFIYRIFTIIYILDLAILVYFVTLFYHISLNNHLLLCYLTLI